MTDSELEKRIGMLERNVRAQAKATDRVLTLATGTLATLVNQRLINEDAANRIFLVALGTTMAPVQFDQNGSLKITATGQTGAAAEAVLLEFVRGQLTTPETGS